MLGKISQRKLLFFFVLFLGVAHMIHFNMLGNSLDMHKEESEMGFFKKLPYFLHLSSLIIFSLSG